MWYGKQACRLVRKSRRPDGIEKNTLVVTPSPPHREAFQTIIFDELALGSERLGVITRNHDF